MKLKYNFAIQEVTDFWAAVPVGKDARRYRGVMSLNESAKDMMEFLREDITEEQLVQKMLETYDVPEEQLRHDVAELIQKLREAEASVPRIPRTTSVRHQASSVASLWDRVILLPACAGRYASWLIRFARQWMPCHPTHRVRICSSSMTCDCRSSIRAMCLPTRRCDSISRCRWRKTSIFMQVFLFHT